MALNQYIPRYLEAGQNIGQTIERGLAGMGRGLGAGFEGVGEGVAKGLYERGRKRFITSEREAEQTFQEKRFGQAVALAGIQHALAEQGKEADIGRAIKLREDMDKWFEEDAKRKLQYDTLRESFNTAMVIAKDNNQYDRLHELQVSMNRFKAAENKKERTAAMNRLAKKLGVDLDLAMAPYAQQRAEHEQMFGKPEKEKIDFSDPKLPKPVLDFRRHTMDDTDIDRFSPKDMDPNATIRVNVTIPEVSRNKRLAKRGPISMFVPSIASLQLDHWNIFKTSKLTPQEARMAQRKFIAEYLKLRGVTADFKVDWGLQ